MKILQYIRTDRNRKTDRSQIHYLDKYGQPRFLDLEELWTEHAVIELLTEIERLFLSHEQPKQIFLERCFENKKLL